MNPAGARAEGGHGFWRAAAHEASTFGPKPKSFEHQAAEESSHGTV